MLDDKSHEDSLEAVFLSTRRAAKNQGKGVCPCGRPSYTLYCDSCAPPGREMRNAEIAERRNLGEHRKAFKQGKMDQFSHADRRRNGERRL